MAALAWRDRGQKNKQNITLAKFGPGLSLGRIRFHSCTYVTNQQREFAPTLTHLLR